MSRIVVKEARAPIEVKAGSESKYICMCGLSKNPPFCDGTHKKTSDEQHGKLYTYHSDGTRMEIK